MAYQYTYRDDMEYAENMHHENFKPIPANEKIPVRTAQEIETKIQQDFDPYENIVMAEPKDLQRIRHGEPKYLIRDLYHIKYPERAIPFKIPMPRPVDAIFKNWAGPTRPEFRKDIPMDQLTGNQKWQLWCAEQFLNML